MSLKNQALLQQQKSTFLYEEQILIIKVDL
jgi:hypothetical protein